MGLLLAGWKLNEQEWLLYLLPGPQRGGGAAGGQGGGGEEVSADRCCPLTQLYKQECGGGGGREAPVGEMADNLSRWRLGTSPQLYSESLDELRKAAEMKNRRVGYQGARGTWSRGLGGGSSGGRTC